jgi:hypothetical protein
VSQFIPPQNGSNVSYRTYNWLSMVMERWGAEFNKPDIAYEFSNGRKMESTDQGITGFYQKP